MAAKNRQKNTRHAIATTGRLAAANRPRYLFSGLTKCGVCGAGFIMGSANRLSCFGARDQGTCSNKLTIRRDEVEARVLKALQEKLRQDLFDEFCEQFTRERIGSGLSTARASQLPSARSNACKRKFVASSRKSRTV